MLWLLQIEFCGAYAIAVLVATKKADLLNIHKVLLAVILPYSREVTKEDEMDKYS